MRLLIAFLGLCIFTSSCKVAILHPDLYIERPAPHVELKNGKIVEAKIVTLNQHFIGPPDIIVDKNIYSPDSVAFFSTGMDYFANVGTAHFPTKIIDGKINVFRSSNSYQQATTTFGSFGTVNYTDHNYQQIPVSRFYLQAAGTKPLYGFSCKRLELMIPKTSPAHSLLTSYKHTRWLSRAGLVLSGGCIVSGAILMANGSRGLRLITGGVVVGGVSFVIGYNNYSKLSKALIEYNKEADATK